MLWPPLRGICDVGQALLIALEFSGCLQREKMTFGRVPSL
jgi:hypothetical protein